MAATFLSLRSNVPLDMIHRNVHKNSNRAGVLRVLIEWKWCSFRLNSSRFFKLWRKAIGSALIVLVSFHMDSQALAIRNCDVKSYYEGTEDLKGSALLLKLHNIVQEHTSISYIQVWEALKTLDEDPYATAHDKIIEIYSQRSVPKSLAGKLDGWNREHLWPRSYGLKQGRPEFTDLHNLRPADSNVNSSRGNKYYGDCKLTESVGDCLIPANREAAADTATDKKSWRPPGEMRGDIARAIMYMAVSYFPSLGISDTPNTKNAEMGVLSIILRWNDVDPPSSLEKIRNDNVCSLYQHNRNPFVDHPGFARAIWEDKMLP